MDAKKERSVLAKIANVDVIKAKNVLVRNNMKKCLVYYSLTGNIDYVAKYISKKMDVDLIKLNPKKEYPDSGFKKFFWGGKSAVMRETPELENYSFDSNKYNHIILATPVWAGLFTPPIRTFIRDNKNSLKNKKISLIMSSGGGKADRLVNEIINELEIKSLNSILMLVDPKDKKDESKDKQIDEFCNKIK